MGKQATAKMRLPEDFIETLLEQLVPFCEEKGHVAIKDAEVLVGRAGRISYVVPEVTADPMLSEH